MIYTENISYPSKNVFKVAPRIIVFTSLFMGVLASIPKIMQLHISFVELLVDASIAFLFTLFVWYYNIYSLPKFTSQRITNKFFNRRILWSLVTGIGLMLVLVSGHQLLFSHYHFQSMILMYEFRGVLINLTICMFLYLLYQSHNTQLIGVELERVKADNLGAQYELLKQQVNPHFLFNSLNTLKSMVEIGDEHVADFIVKLSDFYRFSLEQRRSDVIALSEELEILQAYLFLLKARFEDGINLTIDIGTQQRLTYVPPFTLQLLVENCIKHNVVSLEQPLRISLYATGDTLVMENNLQPKTYPEASTRLGLANIDQRYLHILDKNIIVEENASNFKVILPLIHEYHHN